MAPWDTPDGSGLLDMDWWRSTGRGAWRDTLHRQAAAYEQRSEAHDSLVQLRACTYAERPFGDDDFVAEMAERFRRHWIRGRPSKRSMLKPHERAAQLKLFQSQGSEST